MPLAAFYTDKKYRGMLLLHFCCALNPPLEVVDCILQANPNAVSQRCSGANITPLMIACGRNASPKVVRRLVRDEREAALHVKDASGYTAIHWACQAVGTHKDVVRQLLLVDPTIANNRADPTQHKKKGSLGRGKKRSNTHSTGGISPTDILCGQLSWATSRNHVCKNKNQWDKLRYILWARFYGTLDYRTSHGCSTLHAALALKCPQDVVDKATNEEASFLSGTRDRFGNLPLHYAVQNHHLDIERTIPTLLDRFPAAAGCPDAQGRLPLVVALKHGCTWSKVVGKLLELYPAAVSIPDKESGLDPFQLAVVHGKDIETMFLLLKAYPQAIHAFSSSSSSTS